MNTLKKGLLGIAFALALPLVAEAGMIVGATRVSASAGLPGGYAAPTALSNIIDQSGLSANYVSGSTDFATFVASTTASYSCTGGCFPELGGVAGMPTTITFDLGSSMSIDKIVIWNQAGTASLNTFDLKGDGAMLGSFVMPTNSQDFPQPAEVFSFGAVNARYFDLVITSNYGYDGGTILNEVAFEAAAVPEPETYAVMLAGRGVLGFAARRRRVA